MAIPWGDSVLKQANDAADAKKGVTWEQYAERKAYQETPGSSKKVPKDDVLQHRFYADLDGSGEPANLGKGVKSPKMAQHVSNFYKANPAHEKVTAVGAEDAMSEEQKKHLIGEDEQISEVHNLPERVKRPLVASASDDLADDKKFTEDLHSRRSDGRFIESSGNSSKKYTHKES